MTIPIGRPGPVLVRHRDEEFRVEVAPDGGVDVASEGGIDVPPSKRRLLVTRVGPDTYRVSDGTASRHVVVAAAGDRRQVFVDGEVFDLEVGARSRTRGAARHHAEALVAPMPARVRDVLVTAGQQVSSGDVLVTLEAMKMELTVRAPRDGRVASVACRPGDLVPQGVPLLELT